jgi:hypothetical protein
LDRAIGFLTFEQMSGRKDLGSTRIRAHALIRHWSEAELFRTGQRYSAVIFQKTYWLEYATAFSGIKILDICDPDLLYWNSPLKAMADTCDVVTTSTQPLAELIANYTKTPVVCISDRVDLESIRGLRKSHVGNGTAKTAVWFGYSANFPSLDCAIPELLACDFNHLVVVADSDRPYWLPLEHYGAMRVTNHAWNADTIYQHLLAADIVVNFTLDYGRWKYKSNNKTVLAWGLGLPVAHSGQELAALISEEARIQEAERRLDQVEREYDVHQSVEEYKNLIANLEASGDLRRRRDSLAGRRPVVSQ